VADRDHSRVPHVTIFGGAASQAILGVEDRNGGIRNESPRRTMSRGDEEIKNDMLRQHAMHRWHQRNKLKNAPRMSGQSRSTSVIAKRNMQWWVAKGRKSSATPPRTHGSARMRMHPITADSREREEVKDHSPYPPSEGKEENVEPVIKTSPALHFGNARLIGTTHVIEHGVKE